MIESSPHCSSAPTCGSRWKVTRTRTEAMSTTRVFRNGAPRRSSAISRERESPLIASYREDLANSASCWTMTTLGVAGQARQGDISQASTRDGRPGIVAAFTVNELEDRSRDRVLGVLTETARRGSTVLIVEPIARRALPWWREWSETFLRLGGREDEWRFPADLPPLLRRLDRAAGLDHQELTARSLWVSPG